MPRPLLAAAAGLLGLLLAPAGPAPAAATALPDPLATGPFATQRVEYDAGTMRLRKPTPADARAVPMKGDVVFPRDPRAEPARVVVIVHGRHETCVGESEAAPGPAVGQCRDSTAPDGSPRTTDVRSYAGYDYLAGNLASHGYAVMSVEANVSGFDGDLDDGGADVRSQIIDGSLRLLRRWNSGRGPVTGRSATTIGTKLVGRLALADGIGLMGHSRGGDAVTDFVTYNRRHAHWPLAGVLALAPTSMTAHRTVTGVNYATILPACDGDVFDLQGARLFEDADPPGRGDRAARIQWYAEGANHDFFNTVWTDDDGAFGDPACTRGAAGGSRLTAADQRRVGTALTAGFLRRYVGGETALQPLMTGEVTLPASACPLTSGRGCAGEVRTSYVAPAAQRLDVLGPERLPDPSSRAQAVGAIDPRATTVAATGGPISARGLTTFRVCRPTSALWTQGWEPQPMYRPCPGLTAADEEAEAEGEEVPAPSGAGGDRAAEGVNRSFRTQFAVAWDRPATVAVGLGRSAAPRDVSAFRALSLRVAVNRGDRRNPVAHGLDPASATQDFDVTLVDAAGRRATTSVAAWTTALRPSVGTVHRHVVLGGARIPLEAFPGVDLAHLTTLELAFGGRTPTGSIQLADVAFQERAADAAPAAGR